MFPLISILDTVFLDIDLHSPSISPLFFLDIFCAIYVYPTILDIQFFQFLSLKTGKFSHIVHKRSSKFLIIILLDPCILHTLIFLIPRRQYQKFIKILENNQILSASQHERKLDSNFLLFHLKLIVYSLRK